jgi:hypothetical protein
MRLIGPRRTLLGGARTTAGGTTFNLADKSAQVVLSNADLTATFASAAAVAGVRSIAGRSNGDAYFETTLAALNTADDAVGIGVASLSQFSLSDTNGGGGDVGGNSICIYPFTSGTQAFFDNAPIADLGSTSGGTSDVWGIAVSFSTNKIWFKNITQGGGWNNDTLANQNPFGYVGGIAMQNAASTLFLNGPPYAILISFFDVNDAATIRTIPPYAIGAVPTGYQNWVSPAPPGLVGPDNDLLEGADGDLLLGAM